MESGIRIQVTSCPDLCLGPDSLHSGSSPAYFLPRFSVKGNLGPGRNPDLPQVTWLWALVVHLSNKKVVLVDTKSHLLGNFKTPLRSNLITPLHTSPPPSDWLSEFKGIVWEKTISTVAAPEQEGNTCESLLFHPQLEEGGGRAVSHSNLHPTQWLSPFKHCRMQKPRKCGPETILALFKCSGERALSHLLRAFWGWKSWMPLCKYQVLPKCWLITTLKTWAGREPMRSWLPSTLWTSSFCLYLQGLL